MPRKARILVPNCPHHIVQRGHNRKAVFLEPQDYCYYLENLKEWKNTLGIKIYAWCLMTNHIHIIAEPGDDAKVLSLLMKRVNGRQAGYVNKLEGRSGALWEGRYKASPIQKEAYLLACVRYVELNPLKAKMIEKMEHYAWSSYMERKQSRRSGLLDLDPCYLALGDYKESRWKNYVSFLAEAIDAEETMQIKNGVNRNQLTGSQSFIDEIEARVGLRIETRGRGRPTKIRDK